MFDDLAVVEFTRIAESGGESMMVRPLASEARANNVSDVHGVDNRNSTLGASPKWARSDHRERRGIKAKIDVHLFCLIEEPVPSIHNLL